RCGAPLRGTCVFAKTAGGCTCDAGRAQTCVTNRRKTRRHCRCHSLCSAPEDGISTGEDCRPRGSRNTMMPSSNQTPELDRGYGNRLRQAREAAGLSVAEVSQRLKMPARVIEALESGDADRGEAEVFVRGRLRSYAR